MADPASSDQRIGSEIAGYRIERLLGRGGMSVVYLAHHERLDRRVALKLLAPELSENEGFRERFLRESRLAASLDHPNVIPIYDADEADAVLFIAMRYVEGGDLAKRLAGDGWLEPAEALSIVERVADALDAAHRRGLVHRDVKPGNILISGEGHVYLSDFGLTRQTQETSALTESGQFVGTLDYVAPEQIENQDVSAQTDVYALSCVLFQCLTGTVPFSATSKVGLMFAHLQNERPSARERNPELAAGIDAVLAKGMAKRRQDRYDTATELAEDARPALGLSGEITLPSSAPTFDRRRLLAIGGTSAALIAAAITVPAVLLTRGNGGAATVAFEPDDSVIETIAGTGARGFSGDGGPALEAALSNPVAVVFDASGNLYVADASNNRIRKIDTNGVISTFAGTGEAGNSGDGGPAIEAALARPTSPAFDEGGNLYFVNHNTETVRKIDTEGIISTVAGAQNKASVVRGDDSGLALEARLANPAGIAVDTDGVFYIADREHNRILKVDTDGTFTTIASLRTPGFAGDGGPATEAELFRPAGLALAPGGSIYVADSRNHRIRKIDSEGIITTVAGTGSPGFSGDGGPATGAKLFGVNSLTLDAEGNLYFNDSQESELVPDPQLDPSGNFGNRVRRIDTSGIITTVAGTGEPGFDGDGGPATDAELSRPQGVALDADGNLYIADQDNHRVRKVTR